MKRQKQISKKQNLKRIYKSLELSKIEKLDNMQRGFYQIQEKRS